MKYLKRRAKASLALQARTFCSYLRRALGVFNLFSISNPCPIPNSESLVKRIHIVGRKNHGKTTLTVELVEALCQRGLKVGTLKHSPHHHELDTPGKDSYRHREAGGDPATIVTPKTTGVYFRTPPSPQVYDLLAPLYADCDILLVEGNVDVAGPKLEVWRAIHSSEMLALQHADISAVITDDPTPESLKQTVLPRRSIESILAHIAKTLEIHIPALQAE